jgi:hypothetical protein
MEKKYIMRSFVISACYRTWLNKLKEVKMDGACGRQGEEEKYIYIYMVLVGKTEGKRPVRRPLNNIKMVVKKYDGKSRMGLIWVRIWQVAGCCEHGDEPLYSIKRVKCPDWLRNC